MKKWELIPSCAFHAPYFFESFGERAVVLADVNAVGTDFCGEGGEIVENERDAGGAAERDEFFSDAADGGEVLAFGAELEEVGSAV